jgi:hypothetical protein
MVREIFSAILMKKSLIMKPSEEYNSQVIYKKEKHEKHN